MCFSGSVPEATAGFTLGRVPAFAEAQVCLTSAGSNLCNMSIPEGGHGRKLFEDYMQPPGLESVTGQF